MFHLLWKTNECSSLSRARRIIYIVVLNVENAFYLNSKIKFLNFHTKNTSSLLLNYLCLNSVSSVNYLFVRNKMETLVSEA